MVARRPLLLLLAALTLSCGGSSPTSSDSAESSCTTLRQVTFVRDKMQEMYLWYRELPNPDPSSFSSPEAYLDAVRYRPLDSSFSCIVDKSAHEAFYSDSQFIGIGLSFSQTGESEIRITEAYPASPASDAGLDRGDTLLSVAGRPVADLIRTGELGAAMGPSTVGTSVALTWRTLQGQEQQATLVKRLVTIPTVSHTAVLDSGSSRTGYVHFRNFVQPSVEALNTAFTQVRDAGATDLVLDLRYNGGGLVSVAQHLASLVGGTRTSGQIMLEYVHNDKNTFRNSTTRFQNPTQALSLPRVVVIATRTTASASELVINSLRPFLEVTIVGDTTYGKPVGMYPFDFCGKVLNPVAFKTVNARGEGDYYDGFPVDCAAADDVDHALASPQEASLAEALYVVRNGRCSGTAAAQAEVQARFRARVRPIPTDGWRQTLNAW